MGKFLIPLLFLVGCSAPERDIRPELTRLEFALGIPTNNMATLSERIDAAVRRANELKTERDALLVERDAFVAERERLLARIAQLEADADPSVREERDRLKAELATVEAKVAELEAALGITPEPVPAVKRK